MLVEDWKIVHLGMKPVRIIVGHAWQSEGPPLPVYRLYFGIEGLDPAPLESAGTSAAHALYIALEQMFRRLHDKTMGGIPADRVWPPP